MNLLYISSIANVEGNGVAIAVKNYLKFMSVKANIAIYNLESNIEINENAKSFNIHD